MVSLAEVLTRNVRTEKQANELYKEIYKWYRDRNTAGLHVVAKPQNEMVIVNKEMLDTEELDSLLSLYAAWMAYYQFFVALYKGLADHLESLYKSSVAEYVLRSTNERSDKKRESAAKLEFAAVLRAEQIARSKYYAYQNKYDIAGVQHSVVSRVITMRSDELKAFKGN